MAESSSALTEAVFYILLSLGEPLHGYGIMQRTEELSGGRVKLAAGTLYGALTTLPLPTNFAYTVSGDNIGGFIVTVDLNTPTAAA